MVLCYGSSRKLIQKWYFLKSDGIFIIVVVVFVLLSPVRLLATPWTAKCQASLSFTISQNLLKLKSIDSMMLSNHLILCYPLLLLPLIFPSLRIFSNESVLLIRWPKYWSSSLNIKPSNEYSELISFRIDWFDLLPVQGMLENLLQHNSKASILWCSAWFMVQLSHPYMTTGKTIACIIQIFVSKVMSLLFNMLSSFAIAFLPRNKHLLISQLQSLSTMILEPKKRKFVTVSTFSQSICNEVMGSDAMILMFWMLSFKPAFHSPFLPSSRGSLVPLHFLPLKWYHLHIWGCLYFLWQSWLQLMIHPAWHFTWCSLHRS